MADYSRLIMDSIGGIGDAIDRNRQRAFEQQKYADVLLGNEKEFEFKRNEALRQQKNADRGFGLQRETLDYNKAQPDYTSLKPGEVLLDKKSGKTISPGSSDGEMRLSSMVACRRTCL